MLDKLQKQICRTVGPSLAASLEPLAHRRHVASLRFFYRYYFGRCSSEVAELVPLRYSRYSDKFFIFFNCYLAAPRPTLGHSQGDSLTNPMLITAYLCQPESHQTPHNELGSLS